MSTRLDPDARRDAILQAALTVFSRYGFARASMEDVAREAGLSRPTLYLTYENKAAIFAALAVALAEQACMAAEQAWNPHSHFVDGLSAAAFAQHLGLWHVLKGSPHGAELLQANHALTLDLAKVCDDRFAALVAQRARTLQCSSTSGNKTAFGALVSACLHGIKERAQTEQGLKEDISTFARLVYEGART
jgi:AcrR family transcriptional regulator